MPDKDGTGPRRGSRRRSRPGTCRSDGSRRESDSNLFTSDASANRVIRLLELIVPALLPVLSKLWHKALPSQQGEEKVIEPKDRVQTIEHEPVTPEAREEAGKRKDKA